MAAEGEEARPHRWYFSKEELVNSPSRADGVDPEKELRYRQDAASLIQEMGPRLSLNPLCVSTAIVYMHRFYMINSFKAFDRGIIATAALFLAAKVEELPKKLEFVAKCSYSLLHRDAPPLEVPSEAYNKIVEDITYHELTILQTLGFDVQVKHPHPHVVECMNLVRVSKDLSQAAFFLAHNSQLLTTFCLQYPPTVVACMCIHLTCVWKGLEIPRSNDNKNWWEYVDSTVTLTKLEELAKELLTIVEKSPTRLKKRIQENFKMAVEGSRPHGGGSSNSSGSLTTSSSAHGSSSRQPTAPGMKQKDHHMLNPSAMFSKRAQQQQSGTNSSSSTKQTPHHHHKTHRTSSPPPPPPALPHSHPSSSSSSVPSGTHNSHPHKHRKHKDHHHHNMPPPPPPPSSTRSEKHPSSSDHNVASSSVSHNRAKKFKAASEETHTQHKQHMSLDDYRSKRQHHPGQLKGAPQSKRKAPDANTKHSLEMQSHLPSLPPMNSHAHSSSQSKSLSAGRMHSNHTPLPPFPLPLPSHSHKPNHSPPPPPFTNS